MIFVLFFQATGPAAWTTSNSVRSLFIKVSTQPRFHRALFVEISADDFPDIAREFGARRCPIIKAISQGVPVQDWTPSMGLDTPLQLNRFLQGALDTYSPKAGAIVLAVRMMAVATLAAGGVFLHAKLRSLKGEQTESSGDSNAEALGLKQRIASAQARLRTLEKANRGKQARSQRKLLENLNAQLRLLDRRDQPGKSGKRQRAGDGRGAKRRETKESYDQNIEQKLSNIEVENSSQAPINGTKSKSMRNGLAGDAYDVDIVSRLRRKHDRGETLYSDEEEILEAAEGLILS